MAEDFEIAIQEWVDRAKAKANTAYQAYGQALVARVKELTPVKTGYLRANWLLTLSAEAVPGSNSGARAQDEVARAKIGANILIVNPARYARRIEYGFTGKDSAGRYFNQAPHGMVAQTMAEAPQILARVLQGINAP